jgi:predicted metalloprotease with PDZ domain
MSPRIHVLAIALAVAMATFGCGEGRERPPAPAPAPEEPVPPPTRRGDGQAIEYTLGFEGAHNHYVDVAMIAPTGGAETIELVMAAWTPGSYLVRDYSRHIESLAAASPSGEALAMRKVAKNRWRLATGGAASIAVSYRVYGREPTVRTNFIDADIAMLNGAPTFLTVEGQQQRPHDVLLRPRQGWPRSLTGLAPHPGGAPHHYLAADYDQLVDSPIVAGDPDVRQFNAGGAEHVLATYLGGAAWDHEKAARDVETLTATQLDFWKLVPYRRYVYLNVLLGSGGGLEHKSSTLLIADRKMTADPDRYRRWLSLVSHELFHTWNVKRLRPVELGPFDYEKEVYTRGLWIAEGITSYYDDLLVARAGLMDEKQYLAALSGNIDTVEKTPGRRFQSLSRSSFDAWIKYYRPDESSANTSISYYTKGAVVAFLLDVAIRERSGGRRSLDDLMRLAYQRHSGERGFTIEEFRAAAGEVAGADLSGFFAAAVDGTEDLDYQPALDHFGLRFKAASGEATPYLGLESSGSERLVVSRVLRDTPAYRAGVNSGDELIAIGDERIPTSGLEAALTGHKPGDAITLLVSRRGQLRRLELELGQTPTASWELERRPQASTTQTARLRGWLSASR